jgi:hypothetical protein
MMRSVKITTPIPSLEEFGKRLGLSKARQKALMQIMTGGDLDHSIVGQRQPQEEEVNQSRCRKEKGCGKKSVESLRTPYS